MGIIPSAVSTSTGARRLAFVAVFACLMSFMPNSAHAASHHPAPASYSRAFWVQHGNGWRHLQYKQIASGYRTDVYAALHARISRALARSLAATFDGHIYPTDTRLFGTPAALGRVIILLTPLDGITLGYFDPNDLMQTSSPAFDAQHANRGNILYIRQPVAAPTGAQVAEINEVVAHEFQHLIDYRIRTVDHRYVEQDEWLNEGLSFYAQVANGYWSPHDALKVDAAARDPSWPVTFLSESSEFLRSHARVAYGRAGLFVSYLAARFGEGFIRALVADRNGGLRGVDDVLHSVAPRTSLPQVFADWGVANYLNSKGHYGYGSMPASLYETPHWLAPTVSSYPWDSQTGVRGSLTLKPWSHGYLHFTIKRNVDLRVSVTGPASRYFVTAILQDSLGVNQTSVRWPVSTVNGRTVFRVREFGGFYDQLTLVITDSGAETSSLTTPADALRVNANLIHLRDE